MKKNKGSFCLNCGQKLFLQENYCPNCGQLNDNRRQNIWTLIGDGFANYFNVDSKVYRSIFPLLFRPGFLTLEFIAGKRKKYLPPARMYFTVSIIYFLFLSLSGYFKDTKNKNKSFAQVLDEIEQGQNQDFLDSTIRITTTEPAPIVQQKINESSSKDTLVLDTLMLDGKAIPIDSLIQNANSPSNKIGEDFQIINIPDRFRKLPTDMALDSMGWKKNLITRTFFEQLIRIYDTETEDFKRFVFSKAPILLFLLIPLIGLVLMLFYLRRNFTYLEHLIFAFHTQTVFFLVLLVYDIILYFFETKTLSELILVFGLYLILALKKVYQQNWLKTFFKFILINICNAFVLLTFLFISLMTLFLIY